MTTLICAHPLRYGRRSLVFYPRSVIVTLTLLMVALGLGAIAMSIGTLNVPVKDLMPALLGVSAEPRYNLVVHTIRLPRVLAAFAAGAALGMSGAVFQSISHNALGSPDIIGLTTGAATGAISQIIFFQAGPFQVMLGALIGSLGTAAVIYLLSLKGGVTGGYRLVLIGLGVGSLLGALNSLMMVRGDVELALSANVWISGSLDDVKWSQALSVLSITVVILPFIVFLSRRATLLEMGDDMAAQLGVHAEKTRRALMVGAVLLAGVATSAVGPIAFIALAAPQLARFATRTTVFSPISAGIMGSCLLLLAHVISVSLPTHVALPIGQVTGVIGGTYLAWLLTRTRQV